MSTLADFRNWQDRRVRDGAGFLSQAEKDDTLEQAFRIYSRHRPRIGVYSVAGNGTSDYALPGDWEEGFSTLVDLEEPAGEQRPEFLEEDRYGLIHNGTVYILRLFDLTPPSTETLRLRYTLLHAVDIAGSTIPRPDELAVADLAAALAFRELAARAGQTVDTTIDADNVNYTSQAQVYTQLADRLQRQYREHVGVSDEAPGGGSGPVVSYEDVDVALSYGEDRLFHGRVTH